MTFFYLPEQHPLSLENLPDGRFYTKDQLLCFVYQVPHGSAPVWCFYSGDWVEDHSWTNPMSGLVHETHPLGLNFIKDNLFTDGFYEITELKLIFGEGEAWCPDTRAKIHVDKIDPKSIWNPFFQRYDPACKCLSGKAIKEMSSSSDYGSYLYFDMFIQCQELFFDVYCNCGLRNGCHHHTDSDSD
jgi:hypothetical protein